MGLALGDGFLHHFHGRDIVVCLDHDLLGRAQRRQKNPVGRNEERTAILVVMNDFAAPRLRSQEPVSLLFNRFRELRAEKLVNLLANGLNA